MTAFLAVAPGALADTYWQFGGTCCLRFQSGRI